MRWPAPVVAADWTKYFNSLLKVCFGTALPEVICNDPFSGEGYLNLPAAIIILICTVILVIGIRESATTNAVLVAIKLSVVLFVIGVGLFYITPANWTSIPPSERISPEDRLLPGITKELVTEGVLSVEENRQAAHRRHVGRICRGLFDDSKDGRTAARVRTQRIIQQFYEETARLPKEEAKQRIAEVTGQVMALYLVARENKVHGGKATEGQIKKDL